MALNTAYAFVAFTARGRQLAELLSETLGGEIKSPEEPLSVWTERCFHQGSALIFIGAAGIAVRSVAPFLKSKTQDPAVLVIDEKAQHVIPLLSGHLGGGNEIARQIGVICGAEPVITTATDLSGVFAIDLWAKAQNLLIRNPERIKTVSSSLLNGQTVSVQSIFPISGNVPEGIILALSDSDVILDYRPVSGNALQLVPRCLALGIGCRKGASFQQISAAFSAFCEERHILPLAIRTIASIDLKKEEAGLLEFSRSMGIIPLFYSAEELSSAEGVFSSSDYVRRTTGTDNVCERSAVLSSGGKLIEKKYTADGVTFALAAIQQELDWKT